MRIALPLAALASTAFAQYGYGGGSSQSTSAAAAAVPSASSTTGSSGAVHTVVVGGTSLVFTPASVQAAVGDEVVFTFDGGNHTVTQAAFASPCNPMASGFFSGFTGNTQTSFSITVKDTKPIWFYCAQVSHCESGMVGAINPPSTGNTLAAFKSAAAKASESSVPASAAGGVISTAGGSPSTLAGAGSGSGSGSTSATATATGATSSPTTGGAEALVYGATGGVAKAVVGLVGAAVLLL